jgi:hypothetical protein
MLSSTFGFFYLGLYPYLWRFYKRYLQRNKPTYLLDISKNKKVKVFPIHMIKNLTTDTHIDENIIKEYFDNIYIQYTPGIPPRKVVNLYSFMAKHWPYKYQFPGKIDIKFDKEGIEFIGNNFLVREDILISAENPDFIFNH